jgi:hypothetical protein
MQAFWRVLTGMSVALLLAALLGAPARGTPAAGDEASAQPAAPGDEMVAIERDPFVNPLARREPGVHTPRTIADALIGELGVVGIAVMGKDRLAIVRWTDNRSYTVHEGDEFGDGRLVSIDTKHQELVFLQHMPGEPASARGQEVRKPLQIK